MSSLTLQHFIKSVPTCEQGTNLEVLLATFQATQVNELVIINGEKSPLGIVRLHRLLPYITSGKGSQAEYSHLSSESLKEPIARLPAQMEVVEFFECLSSSAEPFSEECPYALVNSQGEFIGMLNSWKLVQECPTSMTTSANGCWQLYLDALLHLIEQLPLPLMLQTATGQVIGQNSHWREQIQEVPSPIQSIDSESSENFDLEQATEETSDANRWCSLSYDPQKTHSLADTHSIAVKLLVEQLQQAQTLSPLGGDNESEPENFAPQTSQEKVWQFAQLPLNWKVPLTPDAAPVWLVLATDVTEQQQLCKELAAKNADLMQLNRLKDEFLACISHELKTPLTAILGLSNLLKEQSLGELNPRQARYARMVYQSGRQLMSVVNDILDLTRLETGQLHLMPEPVNLEAVCDRAHQQALKLQHEKDQEFDFESIGFTLNIEPGLEMIVADELRLRQMLVHLLSNSLKFTQTGGEIGLTVSRWEGWIALTVWDTGIGIPVSAQHLIFQKFQQLENPLTRRFEGTGLGLVLTQRLARAHGGDISFISKEGEGSQFTLLLPPDPPHSHEDESYLSSSGTDNRLILIVEAVPQYIEALHLQLRNLGYRVAIARSGTEALEKARQLQPRAILLNPLLPSLSGWDVLTLLKADSQTRNIPVLITATRAEKRQAQQNGADGFLSLPIQADLLEEHLARFHPFAIPHHKNLVLLYLNPLVNQLNLDTSRITTELNRALRTSGLNVKYRLLEADDLEQAEILARVWKPDVVLVEGIPANEALGYLEAFTQQQRLVDLPLITLDETITEAAQQFPSLSLFPCLVSNYQQRATALLEVIAIATGIHQQTSSPNPNVLIVGCWNPESARSQWIQALIQYLEKAGIRTSLSCSWSEVHSQIQHHSVELLLLDLGNLQDDRQLRQELSQLAQLPAKPPILILDHRDNTTVTTEKLQNELSEIATQILPAHTQSMADLLEHIHQTLAKPSSRNVSQISVEQSPRN